MSLSYDFQKWTMLSLGLVAISLSVGLLMQYAHGYTDPVPYSGDPELATKIRHINNLEQYVNYCFTHADRPNPLQDLRDKGFSVNATLSDCKQLLQSYSEQSDVVNKMIADYTKGFCSMFKDKRDYPGCSDLGQ